jgi:hypothetical protein
MPTLDALEALQSISLLILTIAVQQVLVFPLERLTPHDWNTFLSINQVNRSRGKNEVSKISNVFVPSVTEPLISSHHLYLMLSFDDGGHLLLKDSMKVTALVLRLHKQDTNSKNAMALKRLKYRSVS